MGRKAKVPFELKLKAVEDYLFNNKGICQTCYELQISIKHFKIGFVNFKLKEAKVTSFK